MKDKGRKVAYTHDRQTPPSHMARSRRGKKGTGRRILLFLVTLVLCLALFCTAGFFLLRNHLFMDSDTASDSSVAVRTADVPAAFNCLIIQTADGDTASRFWLTRFVADPGSITVTALPAETMIDSAGRRDSLDGFLAYGGVAAVSQAVNSLLSISVDHTVRISPAQLESIVDQLGGVVYTVPRQLEEYDAQGNLIVALSPGRQSLTGAYIRQLFTYSGWEEGRSRQLTVQQEVLAAFLNQLFSSYNMGQAEANFLYLVNNSETTFSRANFDQWLPWFQKMAGSSPSAVKRAEGSFVVENGASVFLMDQTQRNSLGQAFGATA